LVIASISHRFCPTIVCEAARAVEAIRASRYVAPVTIFQEGGLPMAIHLTPTELARESGLDRRDVIAKCMELGVPIFQGRIDKTLFQANLRNAEEIVRRPAESPA
jgi:hypothetical protein